MSAEIHQAVVHLSVAEGQVIAITGRNKISFFIDMNTCFLNWNSFSASRLTQFKSAFSVPSRGHCGCSLGPYVCVCV